jgi:hypothetical protein
VFTSKLGCVKKAITLLFQFCYLFVLAMPRVSKTYYIAKDVDVKISEINDGVTG